MSNFDIYVFILCLIVFVMFTALFSYLIVLITKMQLKMMRHGMLDEEIAKEGLKSKKGCATGVFAKVFSLLVTVVLLCAFSFSLYININEDKLPNGVPSLKVVKSDSMASVHRENAYLDENGIDDRLFVFDIIACHHLPAEEDLELYDIVVYKKDDYHIIHRIVDIEEPNADHPDHRVFTLQGDAVEYPDRYPVLYEQMQSIYRGDRIPFVGSFVLFMQSPAGWLCFLLVLIAMVSTPIVEKKIYAEQQKRLSVIGVKNEGSEQIIGKV